MSGEPRPIGLLFLVCAGLLAWLLIWWLNLPEVQQYASLRAVMVQEEASTRPPTGLWEQARWLWRHRLPRLRSLAVLVGLAAGIGLCEGMVLRRRDPLKGFRLTLWSTGLVGLFLLPWVAFGYLVVPWPVSLPLIGGVGAGLSGVTGFILGLGRPTLP